MRDVAFVLVALVLTLGHAVAAPEPISWDEAEKHVGEEVVVEGRVLGIHCSPTSCLLAFDPTFNRFTVAVQARSFKAFPPERLDATFVGRKVRVHGTIKEIDKKPEIVVDKPEDLQLVVTEQDRADERAAAEAATLDRMSDILDRIEALADRLDAAQTRLAELSQAMDERAAQLAQLQPLPAEETPLPAEPSYGTPQPRPGYEALRSIKRGMTSDQVLRLVGEPLEVESGSGGAVTWYYGYGRSVSFDARGRAQSLVGFPAP